MLCACALPGAIAGADTDSDAAAVVKAAATWPAIFMYRYDSNWNARVRLSDGSEAALRLLRPEDKALLREGMEHLSPRSRYFRFFSAREHLTDDEVKYLTELEPDHHVAIGASILKEDMPTHAAAVGRFIRREREPAVADCAIVVVDAYQRLGLGMRILNYLVAAARERGICTFACQYLSENHALEGMIRRLSDDIDWTLVGDGVFEARVHICGSAAPQSRPIPPDRDPGS